MGQALRANAAALATHAAARLWHPDCHLVLFRAGRSFGETGDVAGAVSAFEGVPADQLRVLGPDHPHTLTTRSNLAF